MARVFVHHDRHGRILGIVSVEVMSEDLPHPFYLEDETEQVIEVPEADEVLRDGPDQVADGYVVDVAAGTLVPKESGRPPGRGRSRKRPSR